MCMHLSRFFPCGEIPHPNLLLDEHKDPTNIIITSELWFCSCSGRPTSSSFSYYDYVRINLVVLPGSDGDSWLRSRQRVLLINSLGSFALPEAGTNSRRKSYVAIINGGGHVNSNGRIIILWMSTSLLFSDDPSSAVWKIIVIWEIAIPT